MVRILVRQIVRKLREATRSLLRAGIAPVAVHSGTLITARHHAALAVPPCLPPDSPSARRPEYLSEDGGHPTRASWPLPEKGVEVSSVVWKQVVENRCARF